MIIGLSGITYHAVTMGGRVDGRTGWEIAAQRAWIERLEVENFLWKTRRSSSPARR
jgi:hypothetical protein